MRPPARRRARRLLASILFVAGAGTAATWGQPFEIEGYPVADKAEAVQLIDNDDRYLGDTKHGTVLDTVTGLVWLRIGNCDELPGGSLMGLRSWPNAIAAVTHLEDGLCGLNDGSQPGDWRLPTAAEWTATIERAVAIGCTTAGPGNPPSLTDDAGTACHADGTPAFLDVGTIYWSSTADDVEPSKASIVNLDLGIVGPVEKTILYLLWPVRDER